MKETLRNKVTTLCMFDIIMLIHYSQDYQGRITWRGVAEPFNCVIDAPEKKSKFKGIKSFIAYNITPSVSAPYNH